MIDETKLAKIINNFTEDQHRFNKTKDKVEEIIDSVLKESGITFRIVSRIKSIPSLQKKIIKKEGYTEPLEQITDLVGLRVIVPSFTEVRVAASKIRSTFLVDEKNSSHPSDRLSPSEFGYRSVHYVITPEYMKIFHKPEWWRECAACSVEI